ncbi:BrnA antitoxin family protein [Vitreoscilla filiformis]|jgi:uncharacterized protein (DUF4415 family)|uniref:BrnA antitoxin family protein n=1 Tax=Vitreoscilla filiformis TaxID=63 RepID=UPI0012FE41D3|nr:BrnA antitoxin family protein [Vitreoscilla filiformis]
MEKPPEVAKPKGGRPVQAIHKQPVTLRMDAEALARWRATGKGWQTRAAAVLAAAAPKAVP